MPRVESGNGWQPKLAALETSVEAVTRELGALAVTVQTVSTDLGAFARSTTEHLRLLAVDIASAKAPRATNWQVVVAAGVLILALSAAVIAPLSLRLNEMQITQMTNAANFAGHEKLTLHPVGMALIARLQDDVKQIRDEGSPSVRLKLAVMEERLATLSRRIPETR
jgi:hypothetical protein